VRIRGENRNEDESSAVHGSQKVSHDSSSCDSRVSGRVPSPQGVLCSDSRMCVGIFSLCMSTVRIWFIVGHGMMECDSCKVF
jgi:hypothetical protein